MLVRGSSRGMSCAIFYFLCFNNLEGRLVGDGFKVFKV